MTARAPSRGELVRHLVQARIAGDVATTRQNNLANFAKMSRRDPRYLFGLRPSGAWTPEDVLTLMVRRCGVVADPAYTTGQDTIDPSLTIAALDRLAGRLRDAVVRRERVVIATGHPAGLLGVHAEVARTLRAAGCPVLTPAAGWSYDTVTREGPEQREIRYVGGVAMLSDRGELKHTHSPRPMTAILAALEVSGEQPPGLVVADHGWAGAAGQAGVDAVGFADCNDPALFVGEAEGLVQVSVPLDDNVAPHLYAPMTAYVLDALRPDAVQPDETAR